MPLLLPSLLCVCVTHSMYNVNVRRQNAAAAAVDIVVVVVVAMADVDISDDVYSPVHQLFVAMCRCIREQSEQIVHSIHSLYMKVTFFLSYLLFLCHLHHLYNNNTSFVLFSSFFLAYPQISFSFLFLPLSLNNLAFILLLFLFFFFFFCCLCSKIISAYEGKKNSAHSDTHSLNKNNINFGECTTFFLRLQQIHGKKNEKKSQQRY